MAHKTIIELFEENELAVSKLYGLYSRNFPKHQDFWAKLSAEEIEHTKGLASVGKGQDDRIYFEPNKFARGVIKYVNDFIGQQIKEVKKKKLTHIQALNIALRVERSIVENKNFELFAPNDTTVKDMLKRINKETSHHIKVLMKELGKQERQ